MLTVTWPATMLEDWSVKAKGRMREFASEVCQDLNNEVVVSTPVRTGFLRGSWIAGLNDVPTGVGAADPSGSGSLAGMSVVAASIQLGDTYYAVNTAAYAARVEYGFFGRDRLGRVYNQPGRGFVRSVIARAQEIAAAAALRVGKA